MEEVVLVVVEAVVVVDKVVVKGVVVLKMLMVVKMVTVVEVSICRDVLLTARSSHVQKSFGLVGVDG